MDFKTDEGRAKFLEDNEAVLSAVAWDGYKLKGRGCILFAHYNDAMMRAFESSGKPPVCWSVDYAAIEELPVDMAGTRKMCADYNPDTEAAVHLANFADDQDTLAYNTTFTPEVAPPQAFKIHGTLLNQGKPIPIELD